MIFSRMFQTSNVKEKRHFQPELVFRPPSRGGGRSQTKPLMIQTVVDHLDSRRWQLEELGQIFGGILADRNDSILSPRQPTNDDPAIEHAFPVVFSWHTKGCQVVDSRHEQTGLSPKQTPVAGDVQYVESVLATEARQFLLVPSNTLEWGAIFFSDRNQTHGRPNELEQREVILQDEDCKALV